MEELLFEIYESLPRQGPGDAESTKKAFLKLAELPQNPVILDIGCGNGSQTITLAKLTSGKIIAIDNHAPFIEQLKHKALQNGYADRILGIVEDMNSLDFPPACFDLIWSEGAAYIMTFERALLVWKQLLRHQGYLVISELVWFKKEAPPEIKEYWAQEFPDIKHFEQYYAIVENLGYRLIDYFPLPGQSWWTDYYTPVEKKLAEMKTKYRDNPDANAAFDSFQLEIEMHRKYADYYGYGFYIMQKI